MNEPMSSRNSEVARLRRLSRDRGARYEAGRFLVEGPKLVTEVLGSEMPVCAVYLDADDSLEPSVSAAIIAAADERGVHTQWMGRGGIERISSTRSPQPVVAEVEFAPRPVDTIRPESTVLVAVDVNDPGNTGTLIRSALAASLDAFVAVGDTADPFSPKAVRASAGASFRLPIHVERDAAAALSVLNAIGLMRIGTRMEGAEDCDRTDLTQPLALMVGNEAHGLTSALDGSIDRWVRIPMPGDVESLNVAMAATILTYEIARQRRR